MLSKNSEGLFLIEMLSKMIFDAIGPIEANLNIIFGREVTFKLRRFHKKLSVFIDIT